jgi:hypothetical protein
VLSPLLLGIGFAVSLFRTDRTLSGAASRPARSVLILNGAALAEQAHTGQLRAEGVEAVFRNIDELAMVIDTGGVRIYETVDGRDLADFGLIQAASYPPPTATLLNAIAAYLDYQKVRSANIAGIGAPTKLLQYVCLAQAGLAVPATRYLPTPLLRCAYPILADTLGQPFVLKSLRPSRGPSSLITSQSAFAARLGSVDDTCAIFLAQEFIPTDTTLRLFVFGHQASVTVQRNCLGMNPALRGPTFNPSANATAVDPAAQRLAARAAAVMGFDIASVDLARHWTTGRWYVLEVSATPPICTGDLATDKLRAYSSYLQRRTRQRD